MPHDGVPRPPCCARIRESTLLNRRCMRPQSWSGCDLSESRPSLHLFLHQPSRARLAQEKSDNSPHSCLKIGEQIDVLERLKQCGWLHILKAQRNYDAPVLTAKLPR